MTSHTDTRRTTSPVRTWVAGTLAAILMLFASVVSSATVAHAAITGCLNGEIVGVAATPSGGGYWLVGSDGGVFTYGDAPFYGSMGGKPLNRPVVGIVPTASGSGYWLIAADGGVFSFGDAVAPASNPLPSMVLNAPVVGGARAGANGLELVGADGGVFALGGAPFYGSMGGKPMNKPVVGIVTTAAGDGYWLVGADGGLFAFGTAQAPASNPLPSMVLNAPVVGAARFGAAGLNLTAGDGGVFSLGGAPFYGALGNIRLAKPVSGIAATPDGTGYWMAARDGGVFAFGSAAFFGNAVGTNCNAASPTSTGAKIVQYATDIKNGKAEPGWAGGSVPYSWGGGHGTNPGPSFGVCDKSYTGPAPCVANKTLGTDCSGFARWVYSLAYGSDVLGASNTNGQLSRMHKVATPAPGDLVFYGSSTSKTHHVGIYIGNGQMINALKTGTVVRIDKVSIMTDLLGYWRY